MDVNLLLYDMMDALLHCTDSLGIHPTNAKLNECLRQHLYHDTEAPFNLLYCTRYSLTLAMKSPSQS